ncbi:hypothetical protein [Mycobacterium sp. NPDC006124]|uniref:hypothetical protein n=1 Tax=Mycobacterium sp. NPDC006124 TaxID=3156729 RepID=UPI0033A96EFE
MSANQVRTRRVKAAAAAAGGFAVVAMGLIGVMGGGAPDAHASGAMDLGATTTSTTPAKDMPAKAVPVVKAARYGKS